MSSFPSTSPTLGRMTRRATTIATGTATTVIAEAAESAATNNYYYQHHHHLHHHPKRKSWSCCSLWMMIIAAFFVVMMLLLLQQQEFLSESNLWSLVIPAAADSSNDINNNNNNNVEAAVFAPPQKDDHQQEQQPQDQQQKEPPHDQQQLQPQPQPKPQQQQQQKQRQEQEKTAEATASPITIGYAITLTMCNPKDKKSAGFADGAAVLAHSIHLNSYRTTTTTTTSKNGMIEKKRRSRYDYKLYAFVDPSAVKCAVTTLPKLNYTVLVRRSPVQVEEIKRKAYRKAIVTNGCCGEKEFLKLHGLLQQQHPIMVMMDADSLLLQPLDHLFDAMLLPDHNHNDNHHNKSDSDNHTVTNWTDHVMWPAQAEQGILSRRDGRRNIQAYITHDYFNTRRSSPKLFGVQGGFWILRPNRTVYDQLIHLIREGNFSHGWYDDRAHYPTFYGAPQIQGLLSWYYEHVQPNQHIELHHCYYNNMAQWSIDEETGECLSTPLGQEKKSNKRKGFCHHNCQTTPLNRIFSLHMTTCGKPWMCRVRDDWDKGQEYHQYSERCNILIPLWFRYRFLLETQAWNLPPPPNTTTHLERHFYGYCRPSYIPMNLDHINITTTTTTTTTTLVEQQQQQKT